jgi:2EXR family
MSDTTTIPESMASSPPTEPRDPTQQPTSTTATSNDTNSLAAEFTCFPKLPIEMRLKIWKCAANIPRNVDLWIGAAYSNMSMWGVGSPSHEYIFSTSSPPAILHICRESRHEGLSNYALAFGTEYSVGRNRVTEEATVYVNWEADTICLMNSDIFTAMTAVPRKGNCIFNLLEQCIVGGLRALAMEVGPRRSSTVMIICGARRSFEIPLSAVIRMRSLEDIILFNKQWDPNETLLSPKAKIEFQDGSPSKMIERAEQQLDKEFASVRDNPNAGNFHQPTGHRCAMVVVKVPDTPASSTQSDNASRSA